MVGFRNAAILAVSLVAMASCARTAPPAANTAADEAAIRSVNQAWFKAYSAGNTDGIVALYAEDAVVNAPGFPAARGRAAIRDYFVKDIAASAAAGVTFKQGPTTDIGVSGDLGWESGTYSVADKSGAAVDTGKYVTVYRRKDGNWPIVRDIWNSDVPPTAPAPPAATGAPAK